MKTVIFGIFGINALRFFGFCQGLGNQCVTSSLPVLDVWQSSTYRGYVYTRTFIEILIAVFNGYSPFSAGNAVDGKIVSGSISGSCAQTVNEEDPWWQVQLDNSYPVSSVTITTPESCKTCPANFKLENILVEVADVLENFGDVGWQIAWNAGKQNCSYISSELEPGTSVVVNCSTPVYGNYIRISKHGGKEDTLSFCEVVVSGLLNCTLNEGEASISTTSTATEKISTYLPTASTITSELSSDAVTSNQIVISTSMDINYLHTSNLVGETLNTITSSPFILQSPVLYTSSNEAGFSVSSPVLQTKSTTSGLYLLSVFSSLHEVSQSNIPIYSSLSVSHQLVTFSAPPDLTASDVYTTKYSNLHHLMFFATSYILVTSTSTSILTSSNVQYLTTSNLFHLTTFYDEPLLSTSSGLSYLAISSDEFLLSKSSSVPYLITYSDNPHVATSSDELHLGTSSSIPYLTTSSAIPYLATSSDEPHLGTSSSILYLTTSSAVPSLATSSDEPHLGTSSSISYLTTSSAIPYLATSSDEPHLGTSSSIPYITTSSAIPYLANFSDEFHLGTSSSIPYLTTSSALPYLVTSSDEDLVTLSSIPYITASLVTPYSATSSDKPHFGTSSSVPYLATSSTIPYLATSSNVHSLVTSSDINHLSAYSSIPNLTTSSSEPHWPISTSVPYLITFLEVSHTSTSSSVPNLKSSSDTSDMGTSSSSLSSTTSSVVPNFALSSSVPFLATSPGLHQSETYSSTAKQHLPTSTSVLYLKASIDDSILGTSSSVQYSTKSSDKPRLAASTTVSYLPSSFELQNVSTRSSVPYLSTSFGVHQPAIYALRSYLKSSSIVLQSETSSSNTKSASSVAPQLTSYSTAFESTPLYGTSSIPTLSNVSSSTLSYGSHQSSVSRSAKSSGVTQIASSDTFQSTTNVGVSPSSSVRLLTKSHISSHSKTAYLASSIFAKAFIPSELTASSPSPIQTTFTTDRSNPSVTSKPALASWISSRFAISSTAAYLSSSISRPVSGSKLIISSKAAFSIADISTTTIPYPSNLFRTSDLLTRETLKPTKYLRSSIDLSTITTASSITKSSIVPVWCPCTCEQAKLIAGLTNTNKTTQEVKEEIEEALIELTVNSKTTSVNERKLVSVDDKRDSAKVVGTIGVVFCSVILTLIVLSDLPVLIRAIKGALC